MLHELHKPGWSEKMIRGCTNFLKGAKWKDAFLPKVLPNYWAGFVKGEGFHHQVSYSVEEDLRILDHYLLEVFQPLSLEVTNQTYLCMEKIASFSSCRVAMPHFLAISKQWS